MKKQWTQYGKTGLALLTVFALLPALPFAEETKGGSAASETAASSAASAAATAAAQTGDEADKGSAQDEAGRRVFKDDAGREVNVPAKITRVAPSGGVATLVLYTAAREKLAAVNKSFGKKQKAFIPEKYQKLPEIGQFYGKSSSLNMEALIATGAEVIVDIGEAKKTIREDMDKVQEQTKIPTVFIEAHTDRLDQTYRRLGDLLGEQEHCEQLATYCEELTAKSKERREALKEEEQKTVYWALGEAGLNTNAAKSFQSEVLQIVGAKNVVQAEPQSKGGGTVVSMEEILKWKPSFVLIENKALAQTMEKNEAWQAFFAANPETKKVIIPQGPYGFLSDPPSVNRLIGIRWLGQLLYPEKWTEDFKAELTRFYELFYGITLSEKQTAEVLGEKAANENEETGRTAEVASAAESEKPTEGEPSSDKEGSGEESSATGSETDEVKGA